MLIDKVINHNIIISRDDGGQEVVLMGRGIAFGKKKGEEIDPNLIEKTFHLDAPTIPSEFIALLEEIPEDVIRVTHEVVELIEKKHTRGINSRIYLTLLDHINSAIQRYLQGIQFDNFLLSEIRHLYKEEIEIATEAVKLINERLVVALPIDEAAFITLHIVNAQLDLNLPEVGQVTTLIKEILNMIRYHFKIKLEEGSLPYDRLVTHLKFFARRLLRKQVSTEDDMELYEIIKARYPKEHQCVLKIEKHIQRVHQQPLTTPEKLYLTMHLARLNKEQ